MRRVLKTLLALLVLAGAAAAAGLWWINAPLPIAGTTAVDLAIEPGTAPRAVAQAVADAGVAVPPDALYAWFRLSGQARQIRAGNYAERKEKHRLHALTDCRREIPENRHGFTRGPGEKHFE